MKQKTMRRWSVLIGIAMLLSVSGCTQSPSDPSSGLSSKEPVTGSLDLYIPTAYESWFDSTLKLFQGKYPDVQVTVTRQSETADGQDSDQQVQQQQYQQVVNSQFMAGSGPDLVVFQNEFENLYKVMDAGAFCDLQPYLDADEEFDESQYNMPVLNSGVYKGKRYVLPLTYSVPMLLTSRENLDRYGFSNTSGQSFFEFQQAVRASMEGKEKPDYTFCNPFLSLMEYLSYSGVEYVNYETQSVQVDTPEFKQVMDAFKLLYQSEIQKEALINDPRVKWGYPSSLILDGQTLFGADWMKNYIGTIQNAAILLGNGETPMFVTIPDKNGGLQAQAETCAAVRANSPNKQNAYNFIKLLQIYDTTRLEATFPIPVRTDNLAEIFRVVASRAVGEFQYEGGNSLHGTLLPNEYLQQYQNELQKVTGCTLQTAYNLWQPSALYIHLMDGMTPYFEEQKSYEDCVSDLKAKLTLYLSE